MSEDGRSKTLALESARATIARAGEVLKPLTEQDSDKRVSMAPRQAEELKRFVKAHVVSLEDSIVKADKDSTEIRTQMVLPRQTNLEEALQFIESAFITPRLEGQNQQALVAADWLCVDGFREFGTRDRDDLPIGPLVAIDSRRSPAVWSPGASLPLPSLFQAHPSEINRVDSPSEKDRKLAHFPVICLPSNLVRSPGDYTLLSHEVGHAVDSLNGLSTAILEALDKKGNPFHDYWSAWMREIVADLVGILHSGKAFALSLADYMRWMSISDELSAGNRYPGRALRLALLIDALKYLGLSETTEGPLFARVLEKVDDNNQTADFKPLRKNYVHELLPVMLEILKFGTDETKRWLEDQALCDKLAAAFGTDQALPADVHFRLLPSVMALLRLQQEPPSPTEAWDGFKGWHEVVSKSNAPDWVAESSNWDFTAKMLPTLRPTYRDPNGTKVPPLQLLNSHDHIAFVAATNGQLVNMLSKAFNEREERPWKQMEFFAGTDELLKSVEREAGVDLAAERDEAEKSLLTFLQGNKVCEAWALYRFNGPLVFASYWDWNEPGGRIHISAQLLGTDIRKCPSFDHIWYDELPSETYDRYLHHLSVLRLKATRLADSQATPWHSDYI